MTYPIDWISPPPASSEARDRQKADPADIAWLLFIPCAILTGAAMLLLGASLGHVLSSIRGSVDLLPELRYFVFVKYDQQARYLIALLAPLLLVVLTVALARRPPRLKPSAVKTLVTVSQLVGVAFVLVCLWAQRTFAYGPVYSYSTSTYPHGFTQPYFTLRTLLIAAAFAVAVATVIEHRGARRRLAGLFGAVPRGRACVGGAIALGMTAIWVLAGVNLEHTILNAGRATWFNVGLPLDEVFAVLDGRSPLVNFIPQYGALWPYPIALVMGVFGTSFGVFSVTMCAITGLSLLAIFDVLRRVTGNSLAATMLYLPFLATSLFAMEPGMVNRYGPLTLYSDFPFRYAGPYILVWCLARQLKVDRPHTRWAVFMVGGLVVLNNAEFGVPAFGATVLATLVLEDSLGPARVLGLIRDALVGLLAAFVLVSILTLLRAGSLPHIGQIFFYSRIYGGAEFDLLPTPALGLHIVIYLTYVAAIVLAVVRRIGREPGRLLTSALVWSGAFGLGVGSYFMGRSHPEVLVSMFSAWSLSLVLITAAVLQWLARNPHRHVTLAHYTVLFAVGVAACSLAQTPMPWTQIQRLRRSTKPLYLTPAPLRQALLRDGGGKPEAIMTITGHRLAYEMGIENVSPYVGVIVVITAGQVKNVFQALQDAGGSLLVLPVGETELDVYRAACKAGFSYIGSIKKPVVLALWLAPVPGVAPRACPVKS